MLILAAQIGVLFSQNSSTISLYTNIRFIDEIHLGLNYHPDKKYSLAIELGYNLKYKDFTYSETGSMLRADRLHISLVDQGPLLQAFFNTHFTDNDYLSFSYAYRDLKAERLIEDPGLSGGSTMSGYSEYSAKSSNHGFAINYNRIIKKLTLYAGVGYRHASVQKDYYLEGSVQMPFPSDRTELVKENYIVLNLGINFKLVEWQIAR